MGNYRFISTPTSTSSVWGGYYEEYIRGDYNEFLAATSTTWGEARSIIRPQTEEEQYLERLGIEDEP